MHYISEAAMLSANEGCFILFISAIFFYITFEVHQNVFTSWISLLKFHYETCHWRHCMNWWPQLLSPLANKDFFTENEAESRIWLHKRIKSHFLSWGQGGGKGYKQRWRREVQRLDYWSSLFASNNFMLTVLISAVPITEDSQKLVKNIAHGNRM